MRRLSNYPFKKRKILKFEHIAGMILEIIDRGIDEFCTDIGGTVFNIMYLDKTKLKEICGRHGDYFKELFKIIKGLALECECTPAVLMTSKDYEEEEESVVVANTIV